MHGHQLNIAVLIVVVIVALGIAAWAWRSWHADPPVDGPTRPGVPGKAPTPK